MIDPLVTEETDIEGFALFFGGAEFLCIETVVVRQQRAKKRAGGRSRVCPNF